jgi:hypothetical protein
LALTGPVKFDRYLKIQTPTFRLSLTQDSKNGEYGQRKFAKTIILFDIFFRFLQERMMTPAVQPSFLTAEISLCLSLSLMR